MTTEKKRNTRNKKHHKNKLQREGNHVTPTILQSYNCKPDFSPLQVHKESAQKRTALMFEQTNVTYVAFLQPRLVISITTN